MSYPLLLDEMFSGSIAAQLREKGHDVLAAVADPALIGLADDQTLAHATAAGRALVTANIKDFMPLDARYRADVAWYILSLAEDPRPHQQRTRAVSERLSGVGGSTPGDMGWCGREKETAAFNRRLEDQSSSWGSVIVALAGAGRTRAHHEQVAGPCLAAALSPARRRPG